MIQYKCDLCGVKNLKKKNIGIFTMPRILRNYATDALGVKLKTVERYGIAETHLCKICCENMASMLAIVELDE